MSCHVIDNATLWIGDGRTHRGHLVIAGDRIQAVSVGDYEGDLPVTDVQGACLSPGLIDSMVMGAFNHSILHDNLSELTQAYLRLGVTSCQFCIGTLPWEAMCRVAQRVQAAVGANPFDTAGVLGLYLEGPFQQPDLTGASLADHALPPTPENTQRILDECGSAMTMMNVAPGLTGDAEAVQQLVQAGRIVSMAHSNAPADHVLRCIEAGATVLGHVWDNNAGLIGDSGVQQPTLEHVALIDDRVRFIHMICDGIHVPPLLVQLVLRCRGVGTICLVTDSNIRSGCSDGDFLSDDGRTWRKEGGVIRTDTGWLAGSALLLPDMFRNFVRFTGLPPAEVIRTITFNPATSLNRSDLIGLLAPGRLADLVAWDDRLRVRRVWRLGREIDNVSELAEVTL